MKPDASISLIITVHAGDRPAHLQAALSSVAEQTLPPAEVVVVADGPLTPEHEDVCARARAAGLPLSAVRLKENRGPAAARNAGVNVAAGTCIAFLDADDFCMPERLKRQRDWLVAADADVVGSWCRLMDAEGETAGIKRTPVSAEAIRRWACLFNPVVQSSVFGKRAVFWAHPYVETHRTPGAAFDGEDYALWVAMLNNGVKIANVPEALIAYRLGETFVERRRGVGPFRTDWATKLRALQLLPAGRRTAMAPIAFLTACARLLPAWILGRLYALRHAWRFKG